jgi:hypothetical protein
METGPDNVSVLKGVQTNKQTNKQKSREIQKEVFIQVYIEFINSYILLNSVFLYQASLFIDMWQK